MWRVSVICQCYNPSVCQRENEGMIDEKGQQRGIRRRGQGAGLLLWKEIWVCVERRARAWYALCCNVCQGNRVGMCTIMSKCVGDGEGVETGKLEGKETEGKKNRGKNGNRQIEGRRAAETDREGGCLGVFSEQNQELPMQHGLKRWRESNTSDYYTYCRHGVSQWGQFAETLCGRAGNSLIAHASFSVSIIIISHALTRHICICVRMSVWVQVSVGSSSPPGWSG